MAAEVREDLTKARLRRSPNRDELELRFVMALPIDSRRGVEERSVGMMDESGKEEEEEEEEEGEEEGEE